MRCRVVSLIRWPRLLAICLFFLLTIPGFGYSLLTHEQIVDIAWKDEIEPLLLSRFPGAAPEALRKAHAYAYGGCLIQDTGYYPFGTKFFSDLTHYARSGDFIINLLRESSNLYEYAFAIGALAHYTSDNVAHPTINRAVAIAFPKLRAKFGPVVTYAQDPKAHIRTEFGFDMVQVAKNRYTSQSYHDFIGFEVAKDLLQRAFRKTYGLKLDEVLGHEDLAIGTFRRAVSLVIPQMTRVALVARRAEIVQESPTFDRRKFLFYLSRSEYESQWGKEYRKPGLGARVLAFILKIIPQIGPLKALAFKIPTPETEAMYITSVNQTVESYRKLLGQLKAGSVRLPNMDCDTGSPPEAGEYQLSDRTYARLLDELAKHGLEHVSPELRDNIVAFYAHIHADNLSRKQAKTFRKALAQLDKLKTSTAALPASPVTDSPPSH